MGVVGIEAKQHEGGWRGESTGKFVHSIILRELRVANRDDKHFWKKAYGLHWGLPACFIFPFDEDLHQDYMAHRLDTKLFEGEWEFWSVTTCCGWRIHRDRALPQSAVYRTSGDICQPAAWHPNRRAAAKVLMLRLHRCCRIAAGRNYFDSCSETNNWRTAKGYP